MSTYFCFFVLSGSSSSESESSESEGSEEEEKPKVPEIKLLTEQEMNQLGAKIVRAELMGDDVNITQNYIYYSNLIEGSFVVMIVIVW